MKVLLDHNMPAKMRTVLASHQAFTAREMSWDRHRNGDLLKAAEIDGFDALLTADQSIFYQQNNRRRIIERLGGSPLSRQSDRQRSSAIEIRQLRVPQALAAGSVGADVE